LKTCDAIANLCSRAPTRSTRQSRTHNIKSPNDAHLQHRLQSSFFPFQDLFNLYMKEEAKMLLRIPEYGKASRVLRHKRNHIT
jgi:hypothetical protein